MRRSLNCPTMRERYDRGCGNGFATGVLNAPLNFVQVFGDQIEVGYGHGWDWLLMLASDFQ